MALFYHYTIDDFTKLGIWKIEEPEAFFLSQVPLQQSITHPHKRLQHLAGRFLLTYLFPDFPYEEILIADTRKPYLPDEQYHFSISHCGNYAAAIVSASQQVGIDIEAPSEKVLRIGHKFTHPDEVEWLRVLGVQDLSVAEQALKATVLWSTKEAIFKWYSLGKVDFRQHIQLTGRVELAGNDLLELPFEFRKGEGQSLRVFSRVFEGLVLSYVATEGSGGARGIR